MNQSDARVATVSYRLGRVDFDAHPVVFPTAAALLLIFVAAVAAWPGRALLLFDRLQSGIASNFAWLYIASMTGFLVFAVYLCFSRHGNIRLGPDDSRPEFPRATWFAMLFSAGMGIGMLFFGVAEPMWHYLAPPAGEAGTLDAAREAMGITLFHWCLHPWALYALVALALAYFGYRKNLPLSFRSAFYPLIGDRIHGPIGNFIDVLAVLATLFGLATSLGLGAKQVNAGLNYVFGLPQGVGVQIVLIAVITTMAVASLVSGLDVGIRRLSEFNMVIAGGLLIFLFVAGPTIFLLDSLVANVGTYFQQLPRNSFRTGGYDNQSNTAWLSAWTVFYWGWWISWSPFVGMFIARISKGRTIREFILGVLLVPSAVAAIWMTGFGGAALHQEIYDRVSNTPTVAEKYEPNEYVVQTLDDATGLPLTADEQWLVGPNARNIATPIGVLLHATDEGFETKSGIPVEYDRGVLVQADDGVPIRPTDEDRLVGAYASETKELTLGGYLTEPVLSDDATKRRDTTATALFVMLDAYPFSAVTALLGTLSVILFFVTSSDSASMVADIIASGGKEDPALGTRLFWGILEGVLAAVLLVAGGLKALQTGSIVIGLPFCVLIIIMCFGLLKSLQAEPSAAR
ncbi:BCCT family transporter [Aeoliella mucimassa]|uniref:Glycine betaine transporter OpuD n=1 Tax=Aeoliella mucimassa TaxID=2527972 RepID=A0A518AGR6_9BACT|nr:BCCT family transporter [Aeoliella mucimassa]QDU53918.1 Glycine betaine transporter OpuD [Aeoliella mucimassa]